MPALLWPNGKTAMPSVSSEFGMRYHPIDKVWRLHGGIDLVGWSTVCSPVDGVVIYAGYNGGFGNLVKVRENGTGDELWLAHNRSFLVGPNTPVYAGQPVAIMGTTGASTGVHCHYETHPRGGSPINPRDYYTNRKPTPSGGGSAPVPPAPDKRDDDMTRNTGITYKEPQNAAPSQTRHIALIFNTESGFEFEIDNGIGGGPFDGSVTTPLAVAFDTPSWTTVSEGAADNIKAGLAAVRAAR